MFAPLLKPACLLAALATSLLPLAASSTPAPTRPRLVVLVSVDQFRADYLDRFSPWFGDDGFRRLLRAGHRFSDCRLRHALTATAPGHAAIATGVYASRNGIVANEWPTDDNGTMTTAVQDPAVARVGLPSKPAGACSPHLLKAPTVGDRLKGQMTAARVISISNKDRAAILMGGRTADCAYWHEENAMITSTWYRRELPAWAAAFNDSAPVDRFHKQVWDLLLPLQAYVTAQGPDSPEGKEEKHGLGTAFPHPVDGGQDKPGKEYWSAFRVSPYSSEMLTDFALASLSGEKLGADEIPDLLCVGYSQPDACGHAYGPDSFEIMDSILRLDRSLGRLFKGLDASVGSGNWALALTSDHGVTPLPERARRDNPGEPLPGRLDQPGLERTLLAALNALVGPSADGGPWFFRAAHGYHLRNAALRSPADRQKALNVLGGALRAWPQFAQVFTRDEILARPASDPAKDLLGRVRLGFDPERSQDFVFILKPGIVDRSPCGTNHGSPHACDEHVPLVLCAPGLDPRTVDTPVHSDDIAPTLLGILGLPQDGSLPGRDLLGAQAPAH